MKGLSEELFAIWKHEPVWDGDVISKRQRDELVKQGLVWRNDDGYNMLTLKGRKLIEPEAEAHQKGGK